MSSNPMGNTKVFEVITTVVIIVYLVFIFIKFLYL
jgi:hypothetical protein